MLTREQFIGLEKRRNRRLEELEAEEVVIDGHRNHVPRRWSVRIWNLQVESLIKDECMCFLNINWAGDRRECRIKTGEGIAWWDVLSETEVVWGMGSEPLCLRTDVMELKEKGRLSFKNEFGFEWHGSYADLQSQCMVIELWRYNRFRANTLDSTHKAVLDTYASGPVFLEVGLTKALKQDDLEGGGGFSDDKATPPRFKVTFQLYFQELYDFELNVLDVQAFGLMSYDALENATPAQFANSTKNAAADNLSSQQKTTPTSTDLVQSIYDPSESEDSDEEDAKEQRV